MLKQCYMAFTRHPDGERTMLRIYGSRERAWDWLWEMGQTYPDPPGRIVRCGTGNVVGMVTNPVNGQQWYLQVEPLV